MAEITERPTFELHLHAIRDLFVAPDGDPFDPYFTDKSGVDDVVNQLAPIVHKGKPRITIYLPPDQITPTLVADTRAALDRYMQRRATSAHNDVRNMRHMGVRALVYALVLTLLFALPLILAFALDWPSFVQDLSYAAFLVVGWVAMWCAVEYILFDWLANARLTRVFEAVRHADLNILPEPTTTG